MPPSVVVGRVTACVGGGAVEARTTTDVASDGTITTTTMSFGGFGSNLPLGPILAGVGAAMLNIGAAVFLLVAGIQTLRNSPSAASLHRWWACSKIVLALLTTATGLWWAMTVWDGLMPTVTTTTTAGGVTTTGSTAGVAGMRWVMAAWVGALGLFACAYPVAVLIAFSTRQMRAYYSADPSVA